MKKPEEINSGIAILARQDEHMNNLSPAAKLEMVMQLLGGTEECSECGSTTERPALITPEDARELLGFEEE